MNVKKTKADEAEECLGWKGPALVGVQADLATEVTFQP